MRNRNTRLQSERRIKISMHGSAVRFYHPTGEKYSFCFQIPANLHVRVKNEALNQHVSMGALAGEIMLGAASITADELRTEIMLEQTIDKEELFSYFAPQVLMTSWQVFREAAYHYNINYRSLMKALIRKRYNLLSMPE